MLDGSIDDARGAVAAAVDAALAAQSAIVRGVARPKILERASVCATYDTRRAPAGFSVTCDGAAAAVTALDGVERAAVRPDGVAYRLSGRQDGDVVELRFSGESGSQTVRYRVVGAALEVSKTLHVDRLGVDIAWTLRYRRVDG